VSRLPEMHCWIFVGMCGGGERTSTMPAPSWPRAMSLCLKCSSVPQRPEWVIRTRTSSGLISRVEVDLMILPSLEPLKTVKDTIFTSCMVY
jgi:hypothetical protein